MAKIKRFQLHDTAGKVARKRINRRRTVDIRHARSLKAAQYEGTN